MGVKDMTAGLATEVVGQGLVNRCADCRTGGTACCTAEQAAEDRTSDDAQRLAGTPPISTGKGGRGTPNSANDATEGGDRSLSATARYNERGMATRAR